MLFRRATVEDKPRILEICSTVWDGNDYIPNVLDKWIDDNEGEFTLILEDNEITGLAKFTLSQPGVGWLEGLRVAPEFRSKGYAKEITRYYIEMGRARGLDKLQLGTYYENYASIHVTESYGFQRIANFFYVEGHPEENMQCSREVIQLTFDSSDFRAVLDTALAAPVQKVQKDFLGYGWLFKKLTERELLSAVQLGHLYYTKKDGVIEGAMLICPDHLKDGEYYVVMVTGADDVVTDLLSWTHKDAKARGLSLLGAMIPDDEHLKELFIATGYKNWGEGRREANVFIYELNLKEEHA